MRREMCTGDLDHFTIGAPVQDTRLDIPSYPEEEERHVVHFQAALAEQFFDIAEREGDVPCAVETQRQLGSRLRNHL